MIRSVFIRALALFGIVVSAALATVPAHAVEALFEGPITAISPSGDMITVMGVDIFIPGTVVISTPTTTLTQAELADMTALPNRLEAGFIGGTAIVEGDSVAGVVTALTVFVEPAENVALGELTIADGVTLCETTGTPEPGDLLLNGIALSLLDDARIPFAGATDPNGFAIDVCDITPGAAAVEGYFAGGFLNIFAMEATAILPPGEDQISIDRARCRAGRIEVRGATTGDDGNVAIFGDGQAFANVGVTPDGLGGGTYRVRIGLDACPNEVRVVWRSPLNEDRAEMTATVEIR